MDIIFIQDLKIEAVIGVHDWERRIKQLLVLDIELAWDVKTAAQSDSLSDTLDYSELANKVSQFAINSSFALLETFAAQLIHFLSSHYLIPWLKLTVKKPGALANARVVGVVLERRFSNS